ncbi:hypothetical protein [Oceaniradius stylonematis]|uniref:hypothetical protein n=1 Tax=Oceaniradius stylonematis TaxID=2184161 RepID=UPI00273DEA1F|nr:hypothetical protein [Oceaniradius stylonematis]
MARKKHINRIEIVHPAPVSVPELERFRELAGVRKQDIPVLTGNSRASSGLGTRWFKAGAPGYARPAMREHYRRLLLSDGGASALMLPGVLDEKAQEWEDG